MQNNGNQNNKNLFKLLNLPYDETIQINSVNIIDNVKHVELQKKSAPVFCEVCGSRMHSKGFYTRNPLHPIYQDELTCILHVRTRRFICGTCGAKMSESFSFLEKYKQSTTITPLLVINAMKDLTRSTKSIAEQFGLSDTQVHNIFSMYVDLKRLPLPEYISVDEVYLNIKPDGLYAFVIMDFVTGEIVDIVHNRWTDTLEKYFYSIPYSERKKVKAVISDAYEPYQDLCEKFFPNAVQVLDSFHSVKFLLDKLNTYVNDLLKKYKSKQKKELEEKNKTNNHEYHSKKDSKEIVLLRDYRWVLLKNSDNINYSVYSYYHKKLGQNLNTYQIEKMFFALDDKLKTMRDLKEEYIDFNSKTYDSEDEIRSALNLLIVKFVKSDIKEFIEFASYLSKFKESIVRSFVTVKVVRRTSKKDQEDYYARLSNGPMESFNRKPKDFKRNSRGFSNFDYTRNRILWATRENPPILAVPKSLDQIHSYPLDPKTKALRDNNRLEKSAAK